jgi:hypothetical protein
VDAETSTPEELRAQISREIAKWGEAISRVGVKPE